MARIKGSGIVILKKILSKHHIDVEKQLMPRLSPSVVERFNKTAVSWSEIPMDAKGHEIYESACLVSPHNAKKGLEILGEEMAGLAPWFYQLFFRIQTKEFVFGKFGNIWKSFFDTGTGTYSDLTDHGVVFLVKGFPELPDFLRDFLTGWFTGFVKTIKIPVSSIVRDDKDRHNWKWIVKW